MPRRTRNRFRVRHIPLAIMLVILGVASMFCTLSMTASASPLEDIPEQLGERLGTSTNVAKVMLALAMCLTAGLCLAVGDAPPIGYAMVLIPLVGFFTLIGWMPVFVILLLCVVIAIFFGKDLRDAIQG